MEAEDEEMVNIVAPDPVGLPCFVTVTLNDLAYGGPEEGGWYYSTRDPVETHYCANLDVYARVMLRVRHAYSNEGRPEISSVLSQGRYTIHVALDVVEREPSCRPHYE